MKKIHQLILLGVIVLLTLLNVKAYFHAGVPDTHDGDAHLARFANYKIALRQLQIPPRFAPNLVNNYGYPVFNYNYPLANIVSVPFSVIGVPYTVTYKLLFSAMIMIGLWGLTKLLQHYKVSFFGMVFAVGVFGASPFLTNLILVRGNTGEIMAWGLLPWLFYSIDLLDSRLKGQTVFDRQFWMTLTPYLMLTLMSAFLLSHNVTVLFTMPLLFAYALFKWGKNKQKWLQLGLILAVSVGLTVWFWLPALAEKSLVTLDTVGAQHEFYRHFPTLTQLAFSPIQFGYSYFSTVDSMSFQIGFTQWMMLVAGFVFLIKSRVSLFHHSKSKLLVFLTLFGGTLILLQLRLSEPIWRMVPLANYIQFPWRLSIFVSLLIAVLSGLIFESLPKAGRLLMISLLIIQILVLVHMTPHAYLDKQDIDYERYSQSTSTSHENTPKAFTYLGFSDWAPHPFILSGQAEYQVQHWTGSQRQYTLQVTERVTIAEPTMNFAGWQTTANGQRVEYINDDTIQGRIAYQLQPGEYQIQSQFTQWTWSRIVGNTMSLLTGVIVCSYGLLQFRQRKK